VLSRSGPARRFVSAELNLDRCVVRCDAAEMDRLEELKAANGRSVRITEAGFMGCFLVESDAEGTSARDMARRAGLAILHDDGAERTRTSWRAS
jgi:hypothetical protein